MSKDVEGGAAANARANSVLITYFELIYEGGTLQCSRTGSGYTPS